MRLTNSALTKFTNVINVIAAASPIYLPITNCTRPTGFAKTASAVPVRISCATDAEALKAAPSSPERNVTASTESFTILGSSPKPKYGTAARKILNDAEAVVSSRKTGCRTSSIKAFHAIVTSCRIKFENRRGYVPSLSWQQLILYRNRGAQVKGNITTLQTVRFFAHKTPIPMHMRKQRTLRYITNL